MTSQERRSPETQGLLLLYSIRGNKYSSALFSWLGWRPVERSFALIGTQGKLPRPGLCKSMHVHGLSLSALALHCGASKNRLVYPVPRTLVPYLVNMRDAGCWLLSGAAYRLYDLWPAREMTFIRQRMKAKCHCGWVLVNCASCSLRLLCCAVARR